MLLVLATYTLTSLAGLIVLANMILKIGTMLAGCPKRGPVIRSAAVTVATGFSAIGAGGVLLIAGVLPLLGNDAALALMAALGLAAICLGLGFSHAITILRAVAQGGEPASPPRAEPSVG
ncbi:hypothetical protein [Roseovarius sp. 2305UL8-3]|uniref:hypothetical protein n=1 Tax=Roseovarius conchicola TaxID=3121636 RepID=UPI00352831C5